MKLHLLYWKNGVFLFGKEYCVYEIIHMQMCIRDRAYVAYEVVRDYINSRFYWDSNENVLLYMLPKDMISVDVGSKDYSCLLYTYRCV